MTSRMPARRARYDEGCAAAFALSIVGDRWALLVIRELSFAPKGFRHIRRGIPGVTASVLSGRLAELRDAGLIEHDPDSGLYALTPDGLALRPVLRELGRWGAGRPGHDPRKFMSPSSLMMSLEVMVDPAAAPAAGLPTGFDLGGESFRVTFVGGRPVAEAVTSADVGNHAVFVGSANAVGAALYSPLTVEDCLGLGLFETRGDLAAAQRFADAFLTLGAS